MPLPIVHSAAGYAIARSTHGQEKPDWKTIGLCVILANIPDLDFLPGLLLRKGDKFHHGASHSFGAALICGLVFAAAAWLSQRRSAVRAFFVTFTAYASHIALDYFNPGGKGVPAFWPLNMTYYRSSHTLFFCGEGNIKATSGFSNFAQGLVSQTCLTRALYEVLLLIFAYSTLRLVQAINRKVRIAESVTMSLTTLMFMAIIIAMHI